MFQLLSAYILMCYQFVMNYHYELMMNLSFVNTAAFQNKISRQSSDLEIDSLISLFFVHICRAFGRFVQSQWNNSVNRWNTFRVLLVTHSLRLGSARLGFHLLHPPEVPPYERIRIVEADGLRKKYLMMVKLSFIYKVNCCHTRNFIRLFFFYL